MRSADPVRVWTEKGGCDGVTEDGLMEAESPADKTKNNLFKNQSQ